MKLIRTTSAVGMYRRAIVIGTSSALIAGCASAPGEKALGGDPRPLMESVTSGEVGTNDYLPTGIGSAARPITPLCALLPYPEAAATIDLLIKRGADVNKPCRPLTEENRRYAGGVTMPIDVPIGEAIERGSKTHFNSRVSTYRPQDIPALLTYAEKLLALGAKDQYGNTPRMEYLRQSVAEGAKAWSDRKDQLEAQYDEMARRQSEKMNTIAGVAMGAVGVVAGARILSSDSTAGGIARGSLSALSGKEPPSTTGLLPGAAARSGSAADVKDQVWRDDYRNQVVATGQVKAYPEHERNIPGDVVMAKVGSRGSAEQVWEPQGGKLTNYEHCGACGVGSRIKVTVKYPDIIDYHEYVREK